MAVPGTSATAPSAADAALAGLDPEQLQVVLAPVGPVRVLAGAGTGKTRAITRRIAYQVAAGAMPASQVLAVTFTARAAGELRARLRALGADGVQARTFHAAALRQLSYFWPQAVGGRLPDLVESKARLMVTAGRRCQVSLSGPLLRDVTGEVEWAKVTMRGPDDYPAAAASSHREPPLDPAAVAAVYAAYEEVKRAAGLLDFEDLLLLMAGLIEEHRTVAEELRARYRHFVVDEYQDVNPLQQRLLDAWLGGRRSLCVVGDPDQTIYSFTGASARYLLDFDRRYRDATTVRLVRDYRSTPQVVELANALLGRGGQPGRLLAQQPAGPPAQWLTGQDEAGEAELVARQVRRLIDSGVAASEIALLYRVNAQSPSYEQALDGVGVPYLVRGGERFFERPEVREALVLLRGAARAAGSDGRLVDEVRHVLGSSGWQPEHPPAGGGAERERWENLAALYRLAEGMAAEQPTAGLAEFVADLAERAAAQHVPVVEGVTLASLHAAKGLEWEAVFLVGLVDGVVPISYARTAEELAEERRLLYVGITRARRHLTLSWFRRRQPGERSGRRLSRFLVDLAPRAASGREDASPRGRRSRGPTTAATAAERAGVGPVDPELFERLRQWRSQTAATQRQPAFVVFNDATLAAIAAARPTSSAELGRVPGVGRAKLDRYGEQVLTLLRGEVRGG